MIVGTLLLSKKNIVMEGLESLKFIKLKIKKDRDVKKFLSYLNPFAIVLYLFQGEIGSWGLTSAVSLKVLASY